MKALLVLTFAAAPLTAQNGLRVLRHSPMDSGTAGTLITVTFDRPVAGMLGRSIDASRVMHITPTVPGVVEWRDPVTLRFVPAEPFTPGTRVTVSVDTAAIATNGARTGPKFEFELRMPGPKPLAASVEGHPAISGNSTGPLPTFRVLYSGALDADSVAARSHLEFSEVCGGRIGMRVTAQRAVIRTDISQFGAPLAPYGRDSTGDRFMRVVEMVPVDSLRPTCVGTWFVTPSDTARFLDLWRYRIHVGQEFKVGHVSPVRTCSFATEGACDVEALTVAFTAAVSVDSARKYLHTSPALILDPDMSQYDWMQTSVVSFRNRLVPRTKYTVTVDTALRDVYGRRLNGQRSFTLTAPDRSPGVRQQTGLVTLAAVAGKPVTVTVRTLNVDTLVMHVIPLPDSLLAPLLATADFQRISLLPRMAPALPDTLHVLVPVHGVFNREGNVTVPLPASLTRPGAPSLFAVRFAIKARAIAPDSVAIVKERTTRRYAGRAVTVLEPVVVQASNTIDLGLIVQVSPLMAHLKVAGDAGAVFVTDRNGSPVAHATVSVFGNRNGRIAQHIAQATTDRDGLAMLRPVNVAASTNGLSAIERDPALTGLSYVIVTRGADKLIVPATGAIATTITARLDQYALGTRGAPRTMMQGTVTTDRDLYRPGETVYAKVFAREGLIGMSHVPKGDSVRVALLRGWLPSDGVHFIASRSGSPDTVGTWRTTFSEFGTATDSIVIPKDAKLGTHTLAAEVFVDGDWKVVGKANLRIEEFRPPEFLVTLVADTSLHYAGDTITANVDAKYLFGAPMVGTTVHWSASTSPAEGPGRTIPGTDGWTIGQHSWWDESARQENIEANGVGTLDRNGHLLIKVPTIAGALYRPAMLHLSVATSDLTNQTVTARADVVLQTSSLYVAVKDRSSTWYWRPGVPQTVDAFASRFTGERIAGIAMRVTIMRRQYRNDFNVASGSGRRWFVDTVKSMTVVSKAEPRPIVFTPTTDGAYDVRVEAVDERGRTAVTNMGKGAWATPWLARSERGSVTLKLTTQRAEHAQFALGEVARVSFESPFASADAWITLEQEGVLEQRRMMVGQGMTTLPVPISSRLAPNVWVGVTLLNRDREALRGTDSAGRVMRAGFVELRVDSTAHLLKVDVIPKRASVRPGDSAEVRVRVRNAAPEPRGNDARTEVALWAVDEGVLSMTGFTTPDILRAIDEQRGVAQRLATSVSLLPWSSPFGSVRPGANVQTMFGIQNVSRSTFATSTVSSAEVVSVQSANVDVRSAFRLTAFHVGSAVTDRNGEVTVRAKLPDNITTFRLMATAIGSDNRYGSGEATLLATRRVVLRAALPRFVRAGDSLDAAVALNFREGAAAPVLVTAGATNALLRGDSSQVATVTTGKGAVLRFATTIPEKISADATRVAFSAVDRAHRDGDAVAISMPIRPAGTPRSHTAIGIVRDSGTVTLSLPGDIDPARSTVTFSLGTSPIVAMRSHYDHLRAYSYYSTDFVTASARALLTMSIAERLLDNRVVTRDSVSVASDLQSAVTTLVNRQTGNGDFYYWPGEPFTSGPWVTADVGRFLLDARKAGAVVPAAALKLINTRLQGLLDNKVWQPDTITGSPWQRRMQLRNHLGGRVALAQYLRKAGVPSVADEDSLLGLIDVMSWEDRVELVDLMSQRADRAALAKELLGTLWHAVKVSGKRIDFPDSLRGSGPFPSHIRPAARLLTVTLKLLPQHPLLGALNESIIQQSAAEGGWAWNVHDDAAAIEALADFVRAGRAEATSLVVARGAGGRTIFSRLTSTLASEGLDGDSTRQSLDGLLVRHGDSTAFTLTLRVESPARGTLVARNTPLYYAVTVQEVPRTRPVTPDIGGITVERWYENFGTGEPIIEATEGDLVRVRLRVTVPDDRQYVAMEDMLPAGLEAVDLSMRTSPDLGPFASPSAVQLASRNRDDLPGSPWQGYLYGSWDSGWWSPWEHKEIRDDRVLYFTRQLWTGTYNTTYVARATTAGRFVRPPAHAEEMYNAAVQGRSDGGVFVVRARR